MDEEGKSKLPAPILHHILSFLDDKNAVRTCVLSKSWRHLVSTRPKFGLHERYFVQQKEKFVSVLDKSLQVYSDQKLCIDDFSVSCESKFVRPKMASLLDKWIPIVVQDFGVKKFHLSLATSAYFDLPMPYYDLPVAVFESESLQELYLRRCKLRKINCVGINGNHLKTLDLKEVDIEEADFANVLSNYPLIERVSLRHCKGFRTIKMHNHHNLQSFDLIDNYGSSIDMYLPSSIKRIFIDGCPNWFHHRNYFPGLTSLELHRVPLSDEWFNSFSCNFPCVDVLQLSNCKGFDELKLSSRSIKNLKITMHKSTKKATIDTPSIKKFRYATNISQSISFAATTCGEWNSQIDLSLKKEVSQWFPKLSELVAELRQSQISLVLTLRGSGFDERNLSDISVPFEPVAMKNMDLHFNDVHCDSFYSDLMNDLFRFFHPSEIKQNWKVEFLCKILQMGRPGEEEAGWQQDLEDVSMEVFDHDVKEWRHHPVQGTMNWSEHVVALLPPSNCRFRLKWRRDYAKCFD